MREDGKKFPAIDTKKTGERLRTICSAYQITVKDIQEFAHIASNQAVYSWFNGKALPSVDNFYALSRMTGIPMENMIIEQGSEKKAAILVPEENDLEDYRYHAGIDEIVVRLLHYEELMKIIVLIRQK